MERVYNSLGIPLILDGLVGFVAAVASIVLAVQTWRSTPAWSFAFIVFGLTALSLGVLVVLNAPTRLHVRETEFGFSRLRGSTEWFAKSDVTARIARHGLSSRGWKVLRFDPLPKQWRFIPFAYDVNMLMTDDGLTIRWSELEQVLGIPVKDETILP